MQDGKWSLIMNYSGTKLLLFDIKADPTQKNDLSMDYPEVVEELKNKLIKWKRSNRSTPDPDCRMK